MGALNKHNTDTPAAAISCNTSKCICSIDNGLQDEPEPASLIWSCSSSQRKVRFGVCGTLPQPTKVLRHFDSKQPHIEWLNDGLRLFNELGIKPWTRWKGGTPQHGARLLNRVCFCQDRRLNECPFSAVAAELL